MNVRVGAVRIQEVSHAETGRNSSVVFGKGVHIDDAGHSNVPLDGMREFAGAPLREAVR